MTQKLFQVVGLPMRIGKWCSSLTTHTANFAPRLLHTSLAPSVRQWPQATTLRQVKLRLLPLKLPREVRHLVLIRPPELGYDDRKSAREWQLVIRKTDPHTLRKSIISKAWSRCIHPRGACE